MSDFIIGSTAGEDAIIQSEDRFQHIYIIGKTGAGKTTILENAAIEDIRSGAGVCIVDPHGSFAEKVISHIPQKRTNDVVYFNPADAEYPVGFNILEIRKGDDPELVASELISVFRHHWKDSWGPRTEYILSNTVLALIECPDSTLVDAYFMLSDEKFRRRIIGQVTNPVVRHFWEVVFPNLGRTEAEAVLPIQNKIGRFISSPRVRNIVAQPKGGVDMSAIIETKKILVVNLAKGLIGEDNANLLGSLVITKLYLAALRRQKKYSEQGGGKNVLNDFYVYVDEFQNYATETFASILSEVRKYRVGLVLAHQYIRQVPDEIIDAVFGNVGTIIAFRVGNTDAEVLEKEFEPYFLRDSLSSARKYEVHYKTVRNGAVLDPSFATTHPPTGRQRDNTRKEDIISISRRNRGKPKDSVEKKINERFAMISGNKKRGS